MDGRLNVDFSLNSTVEKSDNAIMSTLISEMLDFNPTYPARDESGNPAKYPDLTNPLIHAEIYKDFNENRRIIFNIAPSFEIVNGLVYKLNFGYENRYTEIDRQERPNADPFEEGSLTQDYSNGTNTLIENYLTYDLQTGDHNVTLLAAGRPCPTKGPTR